MKHSMLGLMLVMCSVLGFTQNDETYNTVVAGTTCKQSDESMNCEYKVGKSLHFSIGGVGDEDAAILFLKADFENGEYYAKVGVLHGCVIVSPRVGSRPNLTFGDLAFVSPRNGKVY